MIYTKDVTVFKDDSVVPQALPENDWFDVDVITCAAPYVCAKCAKVMHTTTLLPPQEVTMDTKVKLYDMKGNLIIG